MSLNQSAKVFFANLKANPRLRWGLLAIVGVLWLYGILEMRDAVQRKNEAYIALSKKIARVQGAATQTEWVSRLKEVQSAQSKLEKRLWQEATIGLAQASMNDWLGQTAQQSGLGKVQLQVAAQEEGLGVKAGANGREAGSVAGSDLWKVTAKLVFDFSPQSFYALLGRLAANEKKIMVESLAIRSSPSPKAELMLVAYFRKSASGTPAEGEKSNEK